MPRPAKGLILLALLTAGCGRAFPAPRLKGSPRVVGLEPPEGYAGDVLALSGENLDPVAANNQVFFPGQTVAGLGFDEAGRLLVPVPYDIFEPGPVIVSTPAGRSEPFGRFINLGSGHPTLGVAVGNVAVRHQPPGLAAAGGDLYVPSRYFRLLLSRSGGRLQLPGQPVAFAGDPDSGQVYVALDDGTLQALDPAAGELGPAVSPAFPVQWLTAAGGRVFAVGRSPGAGLRAAGFNGTGLSPGPVDAVPALAVRGVAASPGGLLVLAAERDQSGSARASVLLLAVGSTTVGPVWVDPPGGAQPSGPMAALQVNGEDRVAVALDDGSVAFLALRPTPAWVGAPVPLVSRGRIGGLAAAPGMGLLATKPEDGMAVLVDPAAGAVLAAVPLRGTPELVAADPASGRAFVSDSASNGFDEIDLGTGRWEGHFELGTGLGLAPGCDCAPAAAYPREDEGDDHRMYFLAPTLRQLVTLDSYSLALRPPVPLDPSASAPLGTAGTGDGAVWVLHQQEIGEVVDGAEVLRFRDLPEAPASLVRAADGSLVVRSLHQLNVYRDGARLGGYSVGDGQLVHLGLLPDGAVAAFWEAPDGRVRGGRWTVDRLAQGLLPTPGYDGASDLLGFYGLVESGSGPLLFYVSCASLGDACVVPFDAQLAAGEPQASPLDQAAPLRVSPDGRYFLWSRRTDKDGVLHLATTADLADFTSWQVPADFAPPNFDPSGEWLYVPVPGGDEIRVLQ